METHSQIIAIIPARGGSKRIPQKNIKLFLGYPIIKYSITVALKSKCFNEVMVSTDDKEVADISLSFGAKVPFFRSKINSSDWATSNDVIKEVLKSFEKRGAFFKYCCLIYPTAVFVTAERLKRGYQLLLEKKVDSVVPVVRFSYPIQRALKIESGKLKMIWPKNYFVRSQDLKPTYHDVGQFYWFNTRSYLKQEKLFAEFTIPLEIPECEVQDIDNEEDWHLAEIKYKILHKL